MLKRSMIPKVFATKERSLEFHKKYVTATGKPIKVDKLKKMLNNMKTKIQLGT